MDNGDEVGRVHQVQFLSQSKLRVQNEFGVGSRKPTVAERRIG